MSDQPTEPKGTTTNAAEVIAQIKALDPNEFSKALQAESHDHFNAIFRQGYGASKGDFEPKLQAASAELDKLRNEITEREKKIQALGENSPDVAKIQARYEATLEAKALEMQELQKGFQEKLSAKDQVVLRERQDAFEANLVRELVALGVDRDYAAVIVQKEENRKRIKWGEERDPRIYQSDLATPFPITDGQRPFTVLAKDLFSKVPQKFIDDRMPNASGLSGRVDERGNPIVDVTKMNDAQLEAYLKKANWPGL